MKLAAPDRFWEVDGLRGVAIVMMVIYHLAWDLSYFGIAPLEIYTGGWRAFQRATAGLFLLVVGVSLALRFARGETAGLPEAAVWRRTARRAATVLAGALLVTLVTWLALGEGFVRFGILHLIAVAMLLAVPFRRLGPLTLLLGPALIALGAALDGLTLDHPWLLWLGLKPERFYTVDYFPLLPWFGVVLLGLGLGQWFYAGYRRRLPLPDLAGRPPVRLLRLMGRHALPIYLLHQPVLIAGLIALGLVDVRRLL